LHWCLGCTGCPLALQLARVGKKVLIIEKEWSMERKIIGEYLQPGGVLALDKLGLSECIEGIDAVPSMGHALYLPTNTGATARTKLLKYPAKKPDSLMEYLGFMKLQIPNNEPFKGKSLLNHSIGEISAMGFHYCRFVNSLRERVKGDERIKTISGIVTSLLEDQGAIIGAEYKPNGTLKDELVKVHAPVTVVCDGGANYHFRKLFSPDRSPVKLSTWTGLILEHAAWQTPIPFPGHGNVCLLEPSPVLFYQISPTETRALICVDGDVCDYPKYIREVISPQLPPNLQHCLLKAVDVPGNLLIKNAYSLFPGDISKQGVLVIGDSFNMRHAVTGGGMTVLLQDVELMARLIGHLDFHDFDELNTIDVMRRFRKMRTCYAGTINVLANALHLVFSVPSGDVSRRFIRNACFDYISYGGPCTAGTIGLLSGLIPNPTVLTMHFFLVIAFAAVQAVWSTSLLPSYKELNKIYRIFHEGVKILMPCVCGESVTVLSLWPLRNVVHFFFPWKVAAH